MSHRLERCLSLDDFEAEARRILPRLIHGFISGGVERGQSVRENAGAFSEYSFVPRALVNVAGRRQSKTLFGHEYATPFGIAPMGAAALCGYRADIALARAAAQANVPMVLSAASLIKLEDVRSAGKTAWYQAYIPGDTARIEPLIDRVLAAGYDTIVVTVDVPVESNRENNLRNGFRLPIVLTSKVAWDCALHPHWLIGILVRTLMLQGMPYFENMDADRGPPVFSATQRRNTERRDELTWEHIALVRRRWAGNLVVKGILSGDDARIARDCGADGIILSNHGGRQLDGAIAPLRILPEIAAEAGSMPVMLDGGVRRGTDVLKALALGASFVFIGRPLLFAAAIAGEDGVAHAIQLLMAEIGRDLGLLGLKDVAAIGPDYLRRAGPA